MAYWERESDMALYDIGGQLLDLGVNFYSEKKTRWPTSTLSMAVSCSGSSGATSAS